MVKRVDNWPRDFKHAGPLNKPRATKSRYVKTAEKKLRSFFRLRFI